jgi:hypothetical protein
MKGNPTPLKSGRGGEIRTHDLLLPKQAFYQAELHPENGGREDARVLGIGKGNHTASLFFFLPPFSSALCGTQLQSAL